MEKPFSHAVPIFTPVRARLKVKIMLNSKGLNIILTLANGALRDPQVFSSRKRILLRVFSFWRTD